MATVSEQKSNLLEQFEETRDRTLKLVETLEKDDFVVQTAPLRVHQNGIWDMLAGFLKLL